MFMPKRKACSADIRASCPAANESEGVNPACRGERFMGRNGLIREAKFSYFGKLQNS